MSIANPSNVVATGLVNSVQLGWDIEVDAEEYRVYRDIQGTYTLIGTVNGASTVSFVDACRGEYANWNINHIYNGSPLYGAEGGTRLGLRKGVEYSYKVTAYNALEGETDLLTQTVALGTPVADVAYVLPERVKGVAYFLIANSTNWEQSTPDISYFSDWYDWLTTNFTTKLTLIVDHDFCINNQEPFNQMIAGWIGTNLDLDIVISPFPAFSNNYGYSAWSFMDTATCIARMQAAHQGCIDNFGKAPVGVHAGQMYKELAQASENLGHTVMLHSYIEQCGLDGYTCIGKPWGWYKPSKTNTNAPGDGTVENTFDLISGSQSIKTGSHRAHVELVNGRYQPQLDYKGDISVDFFENMNNFKMLLDDNIQDINQLIVPQLHFDAFWLTTSNGHYAPDPDGIETTIQGRFDKELYTWYKDRYGVDHIVGISGVNTNLRTLMGSEPTLPLFLHTYNGIEGAEADKGFRYESNHYLSLLRYKEGDTGNIKFIQEVPFSNTLTEPIVGSGVMDWSNQYAGSFLRECVGREGNPLARTLTFTADSVEYNLATGVSLNIHTPTISSDALTGSATISWDVYDSTDAIRYFTFTTNYTPTGLINSVDNIDASVTEVRETFNSVLTNLYGITGVLHIVLNAQTYSFNQTSNGALRIKLNNINYEFEPTIEGCLRFNTPNGVMGIAPNIPPVDPDPVTWSQWVFTQASVANDIITVESTGPSMAGAVRGVPLPIPVPGYKHRWSVTDANPRVIMGINRYAVDPVTIPVPDDFWFQSIVGYVEGDGTDAWIQPTSTYTNIGSDPATMTVELSNIGGSYTWDITITRGANSVTNTHTGWTEQFYYLCVGMLGFPATHTYTGYTEEYNIPL